MYWLTYIIGMTAGAICVASGSPIRAGFVGAIGWIICIIAKAGVRNAIKQTTS